MLNWISKEMLLEEPGKMTEQQWLIFCSSHFLQSQIFELDILHFMI